MYSCAPFFDPVLAGSEEDKPHQIVQDYLELHFCRTLSKKEKKAILKADPKQDCEAVFTPEVEELFQTFWKGKINNSLDRDLPNRIAQCCRSPMWPMVPAARTGAWEGV